MNQTFFDLISMVINKVGYSMDQAWPMVVKYTWAQGIAGLTVCLLFLLVHLFVCSQVYKGVKENGWTEKYVFLTFALVLSSIPLSARLIDTITLVIAPEGAAIMSALKQFQK